MLYKRVNYIYLRLEEIFNVADKETKKIQFDQKKLFENLDKRLQKVKATISKHKIVHDSNKGSFLEFSC